MRPPELRCEIPHERGLSRDLRRVGQKERNRVGARREPRRRRQAAPASVVVMLRETVREKKRMNPERREGWVRRCGHVSGQPVHPLTALGRAKGRRLFLVQRAQDAREPRGRNVVERGRLGLKRPERIHDGAENDEYDGGGTPRGRPRGCARGGREKRHERDQEARPPAPAPVPRPPGRIQREKAGGERERRDRGAACLPPADERNEPDGGEEAQREVEEEPLVRTHEEAPGPVERRMRKVLPACIGRERTAEANDLEGEHCRDRYGDRGNARLRGRSLRPSVLVLCTRAVLFASASRRGLAPPRGSEQGALPLSYPHLR